jgi:saccharopine dehydrogenase-like NADP-dependent oxidoreductase
MTERGLSKVLVLGLGKVGQLVATLLHEARFDVIGVDGVPRSGLPFGTRVADVADLTQVRGLLADTGADAVVSCLPYYLNLPIAKIAHAQAVHYFDLTEDVPTTQGILALAGDARAVLAPQCGLAPGLIGIVGAHLASRFEKLRSIKLKVGALPKHPLGSLGYAFNWSPDGVINEYINDCEVLRGGKKQFIPALEGAEMVTIDGVTLEAATTSGGLGTMCDTYAGRCDEVVYKTMRYPGHFERMRFLLDDLHLRHDRETLARVLKNALPPTAEDFVYVHAHVEGWRHGELASEQFVRVYSEKPVAGQIWRAISWTTAAGICAVVEMVRAGTLARRGFIRQEDIPFGPFLATESGGLYHEA